MTKREILSQSVKPVISVKKVDNNTFEIVYPENIRAIRLHNTDVITFVKDGIILNSGGGGR